MKPQEASLISRVKSYASSVAVTTTPWLEVLMADVIFELETRGRESVAGWMMEHGYATGHGDTIEDLLGELEFQAGEHAVRAIRKLPTHGQ